MEKSTMSSKQFSYKQIYKYFLLFFVGCFAIGALIQCSQYSTLVYILQTVQCNSCHHLFRPQVPNPTNTSIDLCSGRYVYMYNLPSRFNEDVIKNCSSLIKWFDMCSAITNSGLGPLVSHTQGIIQNRSWFETNQFTLEQIFHQRIKDYECLTNDSSLASAIFVPFYAGLDIGRHLWGYNNSVKDASSLALTRWLATRREWKCLNGKDHFFIAGRVGWDFRRRTDNDSDWGSKLMLLPEVKNMTMLTIESSLRDDNEFAIPYPTYFHPASKREAFEWQRNVLDENRHYLYSFLGARRQNMETSIRNQIIDQCLNSSEACSFVDCNGTVNCNEPVEVIRVFKNSTFCLQPGGDTYTRRSTFDSILAGCIPVFFHPDTAYNQYKWHFPENHTSYSVYIPEELVRGGEVSVEKILRKYTESEIVGMRREINRLLPKVIYGVPKSRLDGLDFQDAFDVSVKSVIRRVEIIRRDMKASHCV